MSTPDSKSIIGPLIPKLFILLAISTGIVMTEPPLATDRVLRSSSDNIAEGQNGYPYYFWEDPFKPTGVLSTPAIPFVAETPQEQNPPPVIPAVPDQSAKATKKPAALLSAFIKDLTKDDNKDDTILVLFVGLDGDADAGSIERRIRTRTTIASALSGRAEMLNYQGKGRLKPCLLPIGDKLFAAACEIFERMPIADARWFEVSRPKVCVVYVNENTIDPTLAHMAALAASVIISASPNKKSDTIPKRSLAYIGLNRSERLWKFLGDAASRRKKGGSSAVDAANIPEIAVYSPYATAEEAMLWRHLHKSHGINLTTGPGSLAPPSTGTPISFAKSFDISTSVMRGRLHRIGADDGELCQALIKELEIRGISPPAFVENNPDAYTRQDAILLLSDLDRYHSRLLVDSFRSAWVQRSSSLEYKSWNATALANDTDGSQRLPNLPFYGLSQQLAREVRSINYLEALDGMASGPEAGKDAKAAGSAPSANKSNLGGSHPAEGFSQYDALRRLPARLRELQRHDKVRFRAIGLFGSDVHDKLLLLRALRPVFPEAVFFTNDLDARLWQGSERDSSTNLVVAGAFGLSLDSTLQGDVSPFRSSYQTATYLACLHAVGFGHKKDCPCITQGGEIQKNCEGAFAWPDRAVEIHEVGRTGDQLLSYTAMDAAGPLLKKIVPGRPLARAPAPDDPYSKPLYRFLMLVLAFALVASVWQPPDHAFCVRPGKVRNNWAFAISLVIVGLLTIAYFLPELIFRDAAMAEPRPLFAGINSLPVVAGNLIVVAVGISLMWRSMVSVAINVGDSRKIYPFQVRPGQHVLPCLAGAREKLRELDSLKPSPLDIRGQLSHFFIAVVLACKEKKFSNKIWNEAREVAIDIHCRRLIGVIGREPESRLIARYGREKLASDPCNRALRVIGYTLITALLLALFTHGTDLGAPPSVRGPFFRELYSWTDVAAKATLALIALFAMDTQILILHGLLQLNRYMLSRNDDEDTFIKSSALAQAATTDAGMRDEHPPTIPVSTDDPMITSLSPSDALAATEAPYDWTDRPDVPESFFLEQKAQKSPSIGLWEIPLLRLAASRFRIVTPVAVTPFVLLFIILISRHSVFENISFAKNEIILYSTILAFVILWGCISQLHMSKSFQIVASRLRTASQLVPDDEAQAKRRKEFFDRQQAVLTDLESRTRYGFIENPLVGAILLPLGGLGALELSSLLAPYLK
jgi:hypothetical protein